MMTRLMTGLGQKKCISHLILLRDHVNVQQTLTKAYKCTEHLWHNPVKNELYEGNNYFMAVVQDYF